MMSRQVFCGIVVVMVCSPVSGLAQNPQGAEFQINSYTTNAQNTPEVATDSGGNSAGSDSSSESVQGQRFDSGGNVLGSEFQINSYTTDVQESPGRNLQFSPISASFIRRFRPETRTSASRGCGFTRTLFVRPNRTSHVPNLPDFRWTRQAGSNQSGSASRKLAWDVRRSDVQTCDLFARSRI